LPPKPATFLDRQKAPRRRVVSPGHHTDYRPQGAVLTLSHNGDHEWDTRVVAT